MITFLPEVSLTMQIVSLSLALAITWPHTFDSGSTLGDDNILRCIPGHVFEELVKQS